MADEKDNIVKTEAGQPIVPTGLAKPLGSTPHDTLPRPTPKVAMPASSSTPASSEISKETFISKAIQGMTTYEELAAKKGFKNPDDLAKSYINLESQNKRVEATLADAINARQEAVRTDTVLPDLNTVETQEDALHIVNSLINKAVKQTEDKFDYQMYLLNNPSDHEFAADAIKIVKDNPYIRWEIAFKAAKADYLTSQQGQVREEGKQDAYRSMQEKENLQSIHSSQRADQTMIGDAKTLIEGIKTGKVPLSEAKQYINLLNKQINA